MKSGWLSVFLAACIMPAALYAVEIPLTELLGTYASGTSVSVQVDFGEPIADLSRVSLELVGTITPGWIVVDGTTRVWAFEYYASFAESDPGFWMTGTVTHNSLGTEFYSLTSFVRSSGANSEFLSDGQGEMLFGATPLGVSGTIDEWGPAPSGTIVSAKLIFEGTVGAVAGNWGGVKALFR